VNIFLTGPKTVTKIWFKHRKLRMQRNSNCISLIKNFQINNWTPPMVGDSLFQLHLKMPFEPSILWCNRTVNCLFKACRKKISSQLTLYCRMWHRWNKCLTSCRFAKQWFFL
jgi:hypothetical protein